MNNQTHNLEHGHTIIFNPSGHKYVKDNQYVPGTSGILNMLSNDNLWAWKLNTQKSNIKKAMTEAGISLDKIEQIFLQADMSSQKFQQQTLNIGSIVHKLVEQWLKKDKDLIEPEDKVVAECFNKFKDFWNRNNLKLVESEKILYSEKGFCGTLDLIAKDSKNNLVLIDIKTSNGIFHNYILQLHGYKLAYEEQTGKKINKLCIVRLPKNDDDFEARVVSYQPVHAKAFLGLLHCYNSKQLFDEQVKEHNNNKKQKRNANGKKTK